MIRSLKLKEEDRALPPGFLEWQVRLREHTMRESNGAPHVGVAPLLSVRHPGVGLGVSTHSIICGILPAADRLEAKTREFRELYETYSAEGSKAVYDRGIEYLKEYYRSPEEFDPTSLTTLVSRESGLVRSLRSESLCSLVFYVFDLKDRSELHRFRCMQLDCRAEIHESGPVYENVWWHNTLFHGPMDDAAVLRFRHLRSYDTKFGRLDPLG